MVMRIISVTLFFLLFDMSSICPQKSLLVCVLCSVGYSAAGYGGVEEIMRPAV